MLLMLITIWVLRFFVVVLLEALYIDDCVIRGRTFFTCYFLLITMCIRKFMFAYIFSLKREKGKTGDSRIYNTSKKKEKR